MRSRRRRLRFESLGGWEERAIKELKKLTMALARHSGEDEGDTWRRLITRVSILLMNCLALWKNSHLSRRHLGGGCGLKADLVLSECTLNVTVA